MDIHPSADWVALVAFVVVGAIVGTAIGVLIDQLAQLANEQAALRTVATLVAQAAPPDELLAAVCQAAGEVLAGEIITMQRYGAERHHRPRQLGQVRHPNGSRNSIRARRQQHHHTRRPDRRSRSDGQLRR